MQRVEIVDSHTAGEPTRVVIRGGPALGAGSMAERLVTFRESHDDFRAAVVNEPRGSDIVVGGLLCEPQDPACACGVLFFNNVGTLAMCGHGMIGVVTTLAWLGRLAAGVHHIETPAGVVKTSLHEDGRVTLQNVPSFRQAVNLRVETSLLGEVTGDVAWGGNWFFLTDARGMDLTVANVDQLTRAAQAIRQAVNSAGFPEVDHIELFGPADRAGANSRSFVLCPGMAFDRSPCGTGTSAKLACLAADDLLAPGETWVQQSVLGTEFSATYRWTDLATENESKFPRGSIVPSITGTAYVTAQGELLFDDRDPFRWGIRKA